MVCRIGKKLSLNKSDKLVGMLTPRYFMACVSHPKGKLCLHCVTVSCDSDILSALDLEKFICKFDKNLKRAKSLSRFGMVVVGSVRKRRISSAYAATL